MFSKINELFNKHPIKVFLAIMLYMWFAVYTLKLFITPVSINRAINVEHVVKDTSNVDTLQKVLTQYKTIDTHWGKYNLTEKDVECLTLNAYHEARGAGDKGMIAVMMVTVNRATSKHMGAKSVCDAVLQYKQFSWTLNKTKLNRWMDSTNPKELAIVKTAVDKFLSGYTIVSLNKATHYHEYNINPKWAKADNRLASLGGHHFYSIEPSKKSNYQQSKRQKA